MKSAIILSFVVGATSATAEELSQEALPIATEHRVAESNSLSSEPNLDVSEVEVESPESPEFAGVEESIPDPLTVEGLSPTAGRSDHEFAEPLASDPLVVEGLPHAEAIPLDETPDFSTQATDLLLFDPASMSQVTSVSQLSDVQPTDWAFQALQSLVERYGCIAGYPDGTYRGRQFLTRYEFAAGLNACLDRISELIATGLEDVVTQEDLATLQRLQEEFAAELANLRGRVDGLEARVTELEANQFSTTTVLSGLTWFNLTGAFADGDVQVETSDLSAPSVIRPAGRDANGNPIVQEVEDDPEITFSALTWLTLSTSFTGRDQLVTQLAVGTGDSPANQFASAGLYNTFGVPFTDQTAAVDIGSTDVIVREFFYSFPITDTLQAVVGPRVNWYRYFDNNRYTFFLFGSSSFNSGGSTMLNTIDRGSGAVLLWQISDELRLGVAYLGENDEFLPGGLFNSSSDPSQGLFSPTNTITAEVTFSPSDAFTVRLLYNRSNINSIFGQVGGAIGEPIYGLLDDGEGGPLNDATADTFNINFDWLVTEGIGLFGRYTFASTHIEPGDVDAQAIQLGVAFPDLFKEGAQLTLSYQIPFSVLDGHDFLVSGGGNGGVQYELEATYYYPLTDNIALVPAVYVIVNPNNFSDNPTIFVGNLRTQFSF